MSDLSQYLQAQTSSGTGVTIETIERLLKKLPDTMPVAELNELVKFASNQVGIWEAEWMFSPDESPQLTAKAESEKWSKLWTAWLESLCALVPDVKEQSVRAHNLTVLQYHMSKRIDYNKGNPLSKLISEILSMFAIALNKLGVRGLATHLYTLSIYPKGTVGRNT